MKSENKATNYKEALKNKFGYVREIRKISRFLTYPNIFLIINSKDKLKSRVNTQRIKIWNKITKVCGKNQNQRK